MHKTLYARRHLLTVPVGAALALVTALLGACSKPAPSEEPVRAVRVSTVGLAELQTLPEYAGEIRARTESRLGFRVAGKLMLRSAEVGQRVRKGALLAQLDVQDYKLAEDAGRAQLGAATTNRDLAAAELKRYKDLKDQNFVSGAELERREAALKAAQSQVDQAQSQLHAQGNQAAYTQLLADAPGVITAVEAEPGQVLSAGTPVLRLAHDGPRDVVFAVPEDKVRAMMVGTEVVVHAWSDKSPQKGRVREVAASADPMTRTYAVKVGLDKDAALAIGSTATVQALIPRQVAPQVIKLPTTALWLNGKQTAVWVLDAASMTVRAQPVQVDTADANEAVIAAGLQSGQQVVTAGVHVLSPGQKVMLYQEPVRSASSTVVPANGSAK